MELAGEREDQRHRVFGDSPLVCSLRAREPDISGFQRVAAELVGAGADRLDEFQPRRLGEQLVPPETRNDEDIRLTEAGLQLIEAADLEMLRRMSPCLELGLELVGGMRKADGEGAVVWEGHGESGLGRAGPLLQAIAPSASRARQRKALSSAMASRAQACSSAGRPKRRRFGASWKRRT